MTRAPEAGRTLLLLSEYGVRELDTSLQLVESATRGTVYHGEALALVARIHADARAAGLCLTHGRTGADDEGCDECRAERAAAERGEEYPF